MFVGQGRDTYGRQVGAGSQRIWGCELLAGAPRTRVAETDAYLDGGSSPCLSGGVAVGQSGAVANLVPGTHDEANYGPSAPAQRGNPTKIVKWLNTGASLVTTATYDETGQILTSTDACGNSSCTDMSGGNHTTVYSYADFPAGANAAGNSNAYVTQITDPLGHTQNFSYNYATGQVTNSTDANREITTYAYADPLHRLTQTTFPDGGGSTISYNDSVPSVTTTTVASPDPNIVSTSVMDGMGHVIQTQLSDPSGTDYVDTTYDGEGRVFTKTNPYRSGSQATTSGLTKITYDALGRTAIQTNPDGSTQQWCYDGVASAGQAICRPNASSRGPDFWTDSADEAGHHWQHVSDGLGRLLAVMEPSPSSGAPSLETDYQYDVLNSLTSAVQKGAAGETARTRSFSYDSLSRLLTSTNPETGTICYGTWNSGSCQGGYDANGNLAYKTDANGMTITYTYDALGRLRAC